MKPVLTLIAVGLALSFWWLFPLVVASFIAGLWWGSRKKIETLVDTWRNL